MAAAGAVTMFLGNLIALMCAAGLHIVFTTKQFSNGAEGFWGVDATFAADMRRPLVAQSNAAYLRYTMVWLVIGSC
nr:hypothetical protein [uncultured Celeribacter sp.]